MEGDGGGGARQREQEGYSLVSQSGEHGSHRKLEVIYFIWILSWGIRVGGSGRK